MKTPLGTRRSCLKLLSALPLVSTPLIGRTQGPWPSKAITLVVPVSPGGVVDLVPRTMLPSITRSLGQAVVVDNKPGADLAIGAGHVARSAPDGYTLLAGSIPLTTNPVIKKVPYDPIADFVAVSLLGTTSVVAVVPPSLGVSTLQEFIALAKKSTEGLNYANSATAGLVHLNTELLAEAAGIKLQGVLYKGQSPALTDLMAGRVQIMLASPATVAGQISSGSLRPLAVTGKSRSSLMPDVPTFIEAGFPNVNIDSWIGILAPAKTPQDIVVKANAAFNAALSDPAVVGQLDKMGVVAAQPSAPMALRSIMQAEVQRWPKMFEKLGIRA